MKGNFMQQSIDFYMVTISPWCHLSLGRLKLLKEKYNIEIVIKPIDIFSLFKKYETKSVKDRPLPVQKNRINEIRRWGHHLNIDINEKPKYHPVNPEMSSKLIIASILFDNNYEKTFFVTQKICEAVWVKNLDVSDKKTLNNICSHFDLHDNVIDEFDDTEKVLELYKKNTLEAEKNNVFGVPSFLYLNELYFGQDRMFMLEQSIKKAK